MVLDYEWAQVKGGVVYRCCICGKFCRPVDSSTPFGSYDNFEPPVEEFYCATCVKKVKLYHIEHSWLPVNWRKAQWEFNVAKVLDYILISPEGAAWSVWHKKTEPIPSGYIIV